MPHCALKGERQCIITAASALVSLWGFFLFLFAAGLLSHDVDDDDMPKKTYNPSNWFGGDESKR